MKKNYIKPFAEIVDFDVKEVIMTAEEEDIGGPGFDLGNGTDESVAGGFFG